MNPPADTPISMVVNPLWCRRIFGVLHFGVAV